jgi:hypothetical protein
MYLPGFAGKLLINGTRFAFASLNLREAVDNVRTTNSEGQNGLAVATWVPGTHTGVNGNGAFTLTVNQPSFDPFFNWYLAPFVVGAGLYCSVQVLLNGPGSVSWFCPSFHVLETSQNFDAQGTGGQPQSFTGEGNGNWLRPFA